MPSRAAEPDARPDSGLTVRGLIAGAGSFRLGPVDLAVAPGRVLVVLGPSGAGKTTLLEVIAGLRPHLSGQVRLAGRELTRLPPEQRRIGVVFQDGALFPHLSVRENIRFGTRAARRAPVSAADELLSQLGITRLAGRSPRSLSGGERQRVALARALAIAPRALLLDEPLSALDQPAREEMRSLLQELLAGLQIPAVHVTHDRDEALSLADDLAIIDRGILCQAGPAPDVAARPAGHAAARLLGWSELATGTARHHVIQAGQLTWRDTSEPGHHGPVRIYYRPEDVLLGIGPPGEVDGITLTAPVEKIALTRPLARVTLASAPPITALVLHREMEHLALRTGAPVHATLTRGVLRILPERATSPE